MEINKYHNSKIYKLVSNHTDKIYIGSTVQPLHKRKYNHKMAYQLFKNNIGKCNYIYSYKLIELGEIDIILIENFKCENKEELHAKERYYIELNKELCVNKQIPIRTKEENQEYMKEYNKDYRENNKETLKEKNKKYYKTNQEYKKIKINCECGVIHPIGYKSKHLKTKKHLNYITSLNTVIPYAVNREFKRKDIIYEETICECGITYKTKYKTKHSITKKHLNYITSLNTV